MNDVDRSMFRVRAFARDNGLKPPQYAAKAGLHKNSLRDLFSDNWNPTSETLRKLEAIIPDDWQASEDAA